MTTSNDSNSPSDDTQHIVEQIADNLKHFASRTKKAAAPYFVVLADGDIKLDQGSFFKLQVDSAIALRVLNVPAAGSVADRKLVAEFILQIRASDEAALTWFPNIRWPGGTPPVFSTHSFDLYRFFSYDAGASWLAEVVGQDYRVA